MNAVTEIARPKSEIVALVEANPVMVLLTDAKKFSEFYEAMRRETDALDADVSTEKGRKAIASMAYKVARTKTAIDDAGKKLNEEARSRINAVDESRREIRQQLDALKDEVRKPLTAWETAEETRVDDCKNLLTLLKDSAVVGYDENADDVRKRIAMVQGLGLDAEVLQGYFPQAEALRGSTIATLNTVVERMHQEEAQRVELERLRAEAAERERVDADRVAAAEAEHRAAEAAKVEAEAKARAEAEQKAREETVTKAAEDRARIESERKAIEEREAAERAHAEALAAERRRAEEAVRAAQAERDAATRAETERVAAVNREAAAQAARDADRANRSKVMGAAKTAIMEAGPVNEAVARAIVLAIAAGSVPAISIRF